MNYEKLFKEVFKEISHRYNFKIQKISSNMMALIKKDFGLVFIWYRDDVFLIIVSVKNMIKTEEWNIDSLIRDNITNEERTGITPGLNLEDRINNILIITKRTLTNKLEKLLSGNIKFMDDYCKLGIIKKSKILNNEERKKFLLSVILQKIKSITKN